MEGILGFWEGWWEFLGQSGRWYLALVLRLATLWCVAGACVAVLIAGPTVIVLMVMMVMMVVAEAVTMDCTLAQSSGIILVIFIRCMGRRRGERGCS